MNYDYKFDRIKLVLKYKISEILLKKTNCSFLNNVFISRVDFFINFEYLDIFVVIVNISNSNYIINFLNKNSGFFRFQLSKYNLVKKVPKIRFFIDNYYYKNVDINVLIDFLNK